MKLKLILAFLLFFIIAHEAKSQDIPPPNPSLIINIISGHSINFNFDEMSEYENGILNGGQSTFIRIGAVMDWQLQLSADQSVFYGDNNPANQMELNNVGVVIISTGTNLDDGTNIINFAKSAPIALQNTDATVLTKGTNTNRGYGIRNSFTLNWEMGTQRGNMNNQSLLQQMIANDTYTLNITLTLSPSF